MSLSQAVNQIPSLCTILLYLPKSDFLALICAIFSYSSLFIPRAICLFHILCFPCTLYSLMAPWTSVVLKEFKLCLRSAIQQVCSLHFRDIKCSCPLFQWIFILIHRGHKGKFPVYFQLNCRPYDFQRRRRSSQQTNPRCFRPLRVLGLLNYFV